MIYGIGTDIVATRRLAGALERHGESFLDRILSSGERQNVPDNPEGRARFLARRWAAKEAFAKAFRTGIRGPVTLSAISVVHDDAGAPGFELSAELSQALESQQLTAHLSISDEHDYAVAFVVLETRTPGVIK